MILSDGGRGVDSVRESLESEDVWFRQLRVCVLCLHRRGVGVPETRRRCGFVNVGSHGVDCITGSSMLCL